MPSVASEETRMPAITYYAVVPFSKDDEGNLIPGEAKECPNGDRARRMALAMSEKHAGAIAFSRTGNPDQGDFQDATVIAVYGAVDVSALGG